MNDDVWKYLDSIYDIHPHTQNRIDQVRAMEEGEEKDAAAQQLYDLVWNSSAQE